MKTNKGQNIETKTYRENEKDLVGKVLADADAAKLFSRCR